MKALIKFVRQHYLLLAWLIAMFATLASLSLSEVFHLVPCKLCWYQRIAMYPLAVTFGVGYYRQDKQAAKYAWPLVIAGLLVAFYHSLLQWGVLHVVSSCSFDSPCSVAQIKWFGFLTIPFGSFLSFVGIAKVLLIGEGRLFKSLK